jgi:hypothetical protein
MSITPFFDYKYYQLLIKMSDKLGMRNPAVEQFVQKSKALLRSPRLLLREGESSSFEWTPWVITGVVLGSVLVFGILWLMYRYMIWKPRMKARRAGGLPVSPSARTTQEPSSAEVSSDETRRLFAAIKTK